MPTNVQHFADLGVYKQLKKKTHLTKDGLFPHLPGHPEADARKVKKHFLDHSVLERILKKGSYLSQWLPQGERGAPKES